ncbi:MAG: cobyric acid synthase, partial [Methanomicrobiales archaeon]|nr:cobyric acid synthase [Methanomicrobiales archaeon]
MSLMVLGTASHVGKTLTVAAICRALHRRGIPVAPFKSQNMSLNSTVTADGSEISMAQAVQAQAAGLAPESDMNPILLKPKGDKVSQVILHGRPYRDLPITEYYRETDYLLEEALAAYRRLESRYGHVVVEGAGGAAELNLYDRDIANVRLAKALRLPIILIADIERGGVFAQVYGTVALLPEDIQGLVVGIIINKFRGDPAIFASGVGEIERITGVPVLGIVPFASFPIPSEDSLSIADKNGSGSGIRIGVIRLPRISNFTDFECLEKVATVVYVPLGASLHGYDCIILPGTKNTVEDLCRLQESGTVAEIRAAATRGVPVIGICGGYQMLGKMIIDSGVESEAGEYPGIGLLDIITRFGDYGKTTVRRRRRACPVPPILSSMGEVEGYEIHMGSSERLSDREAFAGDGAVSADGLVFGTYLHGLFENPGAVEALMHFLATRKGIPQAADPNARSSDPFDDLADLFESHVDMDFIVSFFTDENA